MERKHKPGFILPLTLSIIGLSIALVTYMANNGRVFTPTAKTMIEREKARMLARSGIEIAMSQLSLPDKGAAAKDQKDKKDANQEQEKTIFSVVLPHINVWQKFKLVPAIEGIQGEIGVCVMSEEGKLNLNELFDSATGTLVESLKTNPAAEKCMQEIFERIDKAMGGKDMLKAFLAFLKARKTKLDDVTELLMIKEFEVFKDHIFYDPPEENAPKDAKKHLYLTDLFTIWSGKKTLQPWLFSDAVCSILNLTQAQNNQAKERQKAVAEIMKAMPDALTFPDGWNKNLKLLYGKDFASLPKGIETLLNTKFETKVFSVLCYGKIGKTTQKLFAILERVKTSTDKDKPSFNITLKKLYWL